MQVVEGEMQLDVLSALEASSASARWAHYSCSLDDTMHRGGRGPRDRNKAGATVHPHHCVHTVICGLIATLWGGQGVSLELGAFYRCASAHPACTHCAYRMHALHNPTWESHPLGIRPQGPLSMLPHECGQVAL